MLSAPLCLYRQMLRSARRFGTPDGRKSLPGMIRSGFDRNRLLEGDRARDFLMMGQAQLQYLRMREVEKLPDLPSEEDMRVHMETVGKRETLEHEDWTEAEHEEFGNSLFQYLDSGRFHQHMLDRIRHSHFQTMKEEDDALREVDSYRTLVKWLHNNLRTSAGPSHAAKFAEMCPRPNENDLFDDFDPAKDPFFQKFVSPGLKLTPQSPEFFRLKLRDWFWEDVKQLTCNALVEELREHGKKVRVRGSPARGKLDEVEARVPLTDKLLQDLVERGGMHPDELLRFLHQTPEGRPFADLSMSDPDHWINKYFEMLAHPVYGFWARAAFSGDSGGHDINSILRLVKNKRSLREELVLYLLEREEVAILPKMDSAEERRGVWQEVEKQRALVRRRIEELRESDPQELSAEELELRRFETKASVVRMNGLPVDTTYAMEYCEAFGLGDMVDPDDPTGVAWASSVRKIHMRVLQEAESASEPSDASKGAWELRQHTIQSHLERARSLTVNLQDLHRLVHGLLYTTGDSVSLDVYADLLFTPRDKAEGERVLRKSLQGLVEEARMSAERDEHREEWAFRKRMAGGRAPLPEGGDQWLKAPEDATVARWRSLPWAKRVRERMRLKLLQVGKSWLLRPPMWPLSSDEPPPESALEEEVPASLSERVDERIERLEMGQAWWTNKTGSALTGLMPYDGEEEGEEQEQEVEGEWEEEVMEEEEEEEEEERDEVPESESDYDDMSQESLDAGEEAAPRMPKVSVFSKRYYNRTHAQWTDPMDGADSGVVTEGLDLSLASPSPGDSHEEDLMTSDSEDDDDEEENNLTFGGGVDSSDLLPSGRQSRMRQAELEHRIPEMMHHLRDDQFFSGAEAGDPDDHREEETAAEEQQQEKGAGKAAMWGGYGRFFPRGEEEEEELVEEDMEKESSSVRVKSFGGHGPDDSDSDGDSDGHGENGRKRSE